MTDSEAILCSQLHPEAFRLLFDRHYDAVWRYLRRRSGLTAADDLTSETFVRAFAARGRYQQRTDSALPWLLGIAANLVANRNRAEHRRLRAYARTGLLEAEPSGEDDLVERIAAQAQGRRLAAVIAGLRDEDRETFLLSALAGLTYAEIADALNVAEGTVAARISRIRVQLAPLFQSFMTEEIVHG